MAGQMQQRSPIWRLAREQHGVVTRKQLLACGLTRHGIEHRVSRGRLHRIRRGVFVVGRAELTFEGRLMAAVLACGPAALISHGTAAQHWGIHPMRPGPIEISVPATVSRRLRGARIHRRCSLTPGDRRVRDRIPLTSPIRTLADIAPTVSTKQLEAAVNEADRLDLVDPERLHRELKGMRGQRGVPALLRLLDRRVVRLTDSELERRFLRLLRSAGLPRPDTRQIVNGFRVDFFWPDLGLIVEADGLRYHRTASQQARDRLRDQAHTAAGLTTLRFTHGQVRFDPDEVVDVLTRVIVRLAARSAA
jgi:very-short-patch-repair endonuclease